MNLLTKISMYYLRRQQKKQAGKKLTEEQQKKKEIVEGFRKLYHFVHWLNTKGLGNRHQRKAFWRSVREGQPILEKVILQLIERYEVKKSVKETVGLPPMKNKLKAPKMKQPKND